MSTVLSSTSGPQKGKSAFNKPIAYKEPTYHLFLSPQPSHLQSLALKSPQFHSLDHLVDQAIHDRYKDQWDKFPRDKQNQLRQEIAHSLMERADQKSSMQIQKPLADAQDLTSRVVHRLQEVLKKHHFEEKVDLKPFADLIFSNYKSEHLINLLTSQLYKTFGSNPSLSQLKDEVYKEVSKIQKEIQALTETTTLYIRPPSLQEGHSYLNHQGETVVLSQIVPSSYDQNHPDVQNGKLNLSSQGHVIYSTGRIETERKAHQVIDKLIHHTLSSGQLSEQDLIPTGDGSYLYPIMIDSLLDSSPLASQEKSYLLQTEKTLQQLDGAVKFVQLKNGKTIRLVLKPIHFSTPTNYTAFLNNKLSEKISDQGLASLHKIYQKRKDSLPPAIQSAVEFCLDKLPMTNQVQDRLIFHAFICEMLGIPYHLQCQNGQDQTAAAAAIKKGLHQWLSLECWKDPENFVIPDPRQLFNSSVFREYSEAAFFENLPLTDQGIIGDFDGKLHTQNRGFKYSPSLIEEPLPGFVLSNRNLHRASIAERIIYTITMSIVGIIGGVFYLAFAPLILLILAIKFKGEALGVAKHLFLSLLLLPLLSGSRPKWLDRNSPVLKERSFFHTSSKKEVAASLKPLFDRVKMLSSSQQKQLVCFVKTGDPSLLEEIPDYENIFRDIADNWLILQKLLENKASLPSCLKQILKAAPSSPVVLFQFLKNFSQQVVWDTIEQIHLTWPAEEYAHELIRKPPVNGILPSLSVDIHRTHYIVQGKEREYDLPISSSGEDNKKIENLKTALQDLSVFKGLNNIPYPIQLALSQKLTLAYGVVPLWQSMNSNLPVPNMSNRTFILKEGDDSFCWLTITEKDVFKSPENLLSVISFEYSYTFKISRSNNDQWSMSLVALSPLKPKVEKDILSLLESSTPESASTIVRNTAFNTLLNDFSHNLEAAAMWTGNNLLPLKAIREIITKYFSTLSTVFSTELLSPKSRYLEYIERSLQKAQTPEGRELIIQALVSYLQLMTEKQRLELLVGQKESHPYVKALAEQHPEIYFSVLKTVLSPKIYQYICAEYRLNPHANVYSNLEGKYLEARFTKEMKYRHFFAHFIQQLQTPSWIDLSKMLDGAPDSELKKECYHLRDIISKPYLFNNAREQYQMFVKTLRHAIDLSKKENQDPACVNWVNRLAYERYAEVKLYDYCLGLVESVSGEFKEPLTLNNFWEEFQTRARRIKKLPSREGLSNIERKIQKISGHMNIAFDSSLRSNLPYIYGEIQKGEQKIKVLRHGTPIAHSDPLGIFRRIWKKAEGILIPETTSDYRAFKETAKEKGQNILHIILENGEWKYHGDESGRVQARLNEESDNFIPVVFRMDGSFIHPSKYTSRSIESVKKEFIQKLSEPFEKTGFSISTKIKDAYSSKEAFENKLNEVMNTIQEIYFSGQSTLDNLGDFQAFIFLTYAELTLAFCEKLKIDILEAACKDDIDRGNAFKAILVLHHLYMTNNLTPQKLQELMVNLLAPPLIVRKDSILPKRAVFVENVLKVLKRAAEAKPVPDKSYQGTFNKVSHSL